jgi:hypothetical protein
VSDQLCVGDRCSQVQVSQHHGSGCDAEGGLSSSHTKLLAFPEVYTLRRAIALLMKRHQ